MTIIYPLILFLFAFLTHGLLLINDGLYWDGWLVDSWQRRKDWRVMKRFYVEVGMPQLFYTHKLFSFFDNRIYVYRLVTLISTYVSSLFVYLTATHFGYLTESQALVLSLLYLSYTGYHMNVDTIVGIQYTFPTAIFYSAVFVAFFANTQYGLTGISFYLLSILLFLFSFNANSLLVYYFGFIALFFWKRYTGNPISYLQLPSFASDALYLALPFVYWFVKEKLTPRKGYYKNYNRIKFDPFRYFSVYMSLLRYGIEASITNPIKYLLNKKFILIPLLSSFLIALITNDFFAFSFILRNKVLFFYYSIMLLFFATFAYVAVGHPFDDQGWNSKSSMLLHLPVSLFIFIFLSLFPENVSPFIFFFILISNTIYLIKTYSYHFAVYLKNVSWLDQLSKIPDISDYSIFSVVDNHSLKGDKKSIDQEHRSAYLFYMFDWLFDNQTSFGIREYSIKNQPYTPQEINNEIETTTLRYGMNMINHSGKQALVVISTGDHNVSQFGAIINYLLCKFKIKNNHSYLSISKIDFIPLQN